MTLRKIDTSRLYLPERHFQLDPCASNVPESIALLNDGTGFGHYDGEYLSVLGAVTDALRQVFRCAHPAVFPVPGSGLAALEVILANCCEPGDTVLVVDGGEDARRSVRCARDAGLTVVGVGDGDGRAPVEVERIDRALREHRPGLVVVVHGDTGSGVCQDPAPVREVAEAAGCPVVVDVSSTLGGQAVRVDDWGVDGAYACVQRCLNCPPGLAVLSMSQRLVDRSRDRSTPVDSLQTRLDELMQAQGEGAQAMSFNPSVDIGLVFCLQAALGLCLAEGLENRWRRHADAARRLLADLEALGFTPAVEPRGRLDTIVAVHPPQDVEANEMRLALSRRYRIDVGVEEGDRGVARWLVGLMGINATRPVVQLVAQAVERLLGTP